MYYPTVSKILSVMLEILGSFVPDFETQMVYLCILSPQIKVIEINYLVNV